MFHGYLHKRNKIDLKLTQLPTRIITQTDGEFTFRTVASEMKFCKGFTVSAVSGTAIKWEDEWRENAKACQGFSFNDHECDLIAKIAQNKRLER